MFLSVPLLIEIGIPQTKICRKIDDMLGNGGVFFDIMLCLPVREGEKKDIGGDEFGGIAELERGLLAEVGMRLIEILAQLLA